jgi:hypothetical protein
VQRTQRRLGIRANRNRPGQQPQAGADQQGSGNRADRAEYQPRVQERPPDKAIGCPDQFHDFDFGPPVVDFKANGITDDQNDGGRQQHGHDPDRAAAERQNRL